MADAPGTTLAELLKRLRQAARLTQEELAEAAGISVRSVSDLERGINRTTRKETARLLCEALDLSGSARELFEAVARGRPGPNGPDVDQPAGQLPVPPTPLALALNNAGQRTQAQETAQRPSKRPGQQERRRPPTNSPTASKSTTSPAELQQCRKWFT